MDHDGVLYTDHILHTWIPTNAEKSPIRPKTKLVVLPQNMFARMKRYKKKTKMPLQSNKTNKNQEPKHTKLFICLVIIWTLFNNLTVP